MKFLIKKVTIADRSSSYFNKIKDILIVDGIIEKIEDTINDLEAYCIQKEGVYISQGWVDLKAHFCLFLRLLQGFPLPLEAIQGG